MGEADIAELRAGGGRVAGLCCDMLDFYLASYRGFGHSALALHDAVAVAAAIDPGIVSTTPCHVEVDLDGEYTMGKTVVDLRGLWRREPNAEVGLALDLPAFLALVRRLIWSFDTGAA